MSQRLVGLFCALSAWGVMGCDQLVEMIGEKAAEKVQEAAEVATSGASLGRPDAAAQAMSLYAQGYNVLIDDPQECLTEYFDDVPLEGPQDGQKYRFFPSHTRGTIELGKVKESFAQAASSAPEKLAHLKPLSEDTWKNLSEACSVFAEVHKYYDAEDYKDDAGKKGQDLHGKMVKIAEATQASMKKFEGELSKIEAEQSKKELAQFEKDKGYSYWFRLYSIESKKLVGAKDPKEFGTRLAAVDKAHTGLTEFVKSKGDGVHAAFTSFTSQADRFHSTAKKLGRALAEEEPKPADVQRLRGQLTDAFNSIVSIGNSLRQLEANNLLK